METEKLIELRKLSFELASRSLVIDEKTLPEIIKNAEIIFAWLMK